MKKESRILISKCYNYTCIGIILRLNSLDGFIASKGKCEDFCQKLKLSGYFYEIGYYNGDCSCGINEYTDVNPYFINFLNNILKEIYSKNMI
ncbi:MAG: hypothetical protein ACP5I6_03945 [Caldisphaera sp.]|nr:hypothetical protein [Caldisphaera sp.]PMP61165.1 MAG: hypothetical protein C0201_00495 [Caldisphaera sp.]PMP90836.1 MAG: hypothetical protein C0171_04075 [Caldisphaera sp.]